MAPALAAAGAPAAGALAALGWSDWFAPGQPHAGTVARVMAVDRDQMWLADAAGPFRARLAGRLRQEAADPAERPCVGDWVCVEAPRAAGPAVVCARLPRRTVLRRRAAGSASGVQTIAANVDEVIIAQGCDADFNLKRLERYLVMAREGGARASVVLTKADLVGPDGVAARLAALRATGLDAPVLALSLVSPGGADTLARRLQPGQTYCVAGSSGVGKSTLINQLAGHALQATGTVSATGEGRHTTVRRQLIALAGGALAGGALVIDTPGMREFGLTDAAGGLADCFADIAALASRCRYRDCRHSGEPGCAVEAALLAGTLPRAHLENARSLREEAAFHAMNAAEKRGKDRAFGRMIHAARKHAARHGEREG